MDAALGRERRLCAVYPRTRIAAFALHRLGCRDLFHLEVMQAAMRLSDT